MQTKNTTRRTFLQVLATGSAAACVAPLAGCGGPGGLIAAGNIADLATGQLIAITGEGVAIGLDADGLYALTTICTHLQCDMAVQGTIAQDELFCECHESRFDGDGEVLDGPATQPLDFFSVSIDDDGVITIDADVIVDAADRLAV